MKIPEIREELLILSAELAALSARMEALVEEMKRRPLIKRAAVTSVPFTPALAAQIRAYATANPSLSQTSIGFKFNVNPGRVSQALRGLRK